MAFFGFFRLGELLPESGKAFNSTTGMTLGDVAVNDKQSPGMVRIHLKKIQDRPAGGWHRHYF